MSLAENKRRIRRHDEGATGTQDVSFDGSAGHKVAAIVALRRVFDLTHVESKEVFEADYMKMCGSDMAEVKEQYRRIARNSFGRSAAEKAKADEHWDAHWVEYTGPTYFDLG